MSKYDFNDNWFIYEKGSPQNLRAIIVPHDAMIFEKRSEDSLGGKNISWYPGGDYVYEKTFFVPEEYYGQSIIFEFEGVYKDAEIYINNIKVAFRPYGYTNFYIDSTNYLKIGKENKIKLTVKNSDQPNSRWYSGTGIYRPVNLFVLPPNI